jgi:hypothetical protein
MLLFEFCESTSPLFRKISFTKPPRITYKADNYEFFTDFTELLTRNEDFIAKIKDSEGGHEQGEHKIDIAFRVGNVFVAIQAACQQFSTAKVHQAKLNAKFCESINAFASSVHRFERGTKAIFVFATMFDFNITKQTQKLIDKQTKFTVMKLAEFEDCIFPFFLLRNKEKLRDGAQIRDLISLYYRRITGHPAPNNKVGVFGTNRSEFEKSAFTVLYSLEKIIGLNFTQKLVDILLDQQHPKRVSLLILLNSNLSLNDLKSTLEKDF